MARTTTLIAWMKRYSIHATLHLHTSMEMKSLSFRQILSFRQRRAMEGTGTTSSTTLCSPHYMKCFLQAVFPTLRFMVPMIQWKIYLSLTCNEARSDVVVRYASAFEVQCSRFHVEDCACVIVMKSLGVASHMQRYALHVGGLTTMLWQGPQLLCLCGSTRSF